MTNPTHREVESYIRFRALQLAPHIDAEIFVRQCIAESGENRSAHSSAGAIGLFQLEPPTAHELGVDPYNWRQNVDGGIHYDRQLFQRFGSVELMLAAYNWGPGALHHCVMVHADAWRDHLPQETAEYLRRILA